MSENLDAHSARDDRKALPPLDPPRFDPRVRRTRDRLGDALIDLIHEQAFEAITVQDVLDKAGVSRSTFYAHFQDKDDLFWSDVDEFLRHFAALPERTKESSDRVLPIREFFEHVRDARPLFDSLVESNKLHELMELARRHFAHAIARRLTVLRRSRHLDEPGIVLCAEAHAGAACSLLLWWLRDGSSTASEVMDDRFHALVWRGVG